MRLIYTSLNNIGRILDILKFDIITKKKKKKIIANRIFERYTAYSVHKEIFNEIIQTSSSILNIPCENKKESDKL